MWKSDEKFTSRKTKRKNGDRREWSWKQCLSMGEGVKEM